MPGEFSNAFARVEVPELDEGVPAGAHHEISSHLDGVDGPFMSAQVPEHLARLSIPHAQSGIFGAGHDALCVQTDVQDAERVIFETSNGSIILPDRPDDARRIR